VMRWGGEVTSHTLTTFQDPLFAQARRGNYFVPKKPGV